MILELRNVASLTEARFAAGEGFTHIRLANDLVFNSNLLAIEGIRGFLSGVLVGCNADVSPNADDLNFDYVVKSDGDAQTLIHSRSGETVGITIIIDGVDKVVGEPSRVNLFSLPSPGEEETGVLADYSWLEQQLEDLREHFGR